MRPVISQLLAALLLFFAHAVQAQSDVHGVRPQFAEVFFSTYDTGTDEASSIDSQLYGGQLSLGGPVHAKVRFQWDGALVRYPSGTLYKTALRAYRRSEKYLLGLGYEYSQLSIFKSNILSVDFEKYENHVITATGSIYHEWKNQDRNHVAAELVLLIYPAANWLIATGAEMSDNDFQNFESSLITRLEFMPNLFGKRNWSVWAQLSGNHLLEMSVSIRYYVGHFDSLRAHHRGNGYYSARFK